MGLITDARTGTLGANSNGDGADVWMVGATYAMGNNLLYAGYGQGDNAKSKGISYSDYKAWEIVGVHNFSKRTLAYTGIVYVDPDKTSDVTHYTLGVKHTF
jgi:predicted porin